MGCNDTNGDQPFLTTLVVSMETAEMYERAAEALRQQGRDVEVSVFAGDDPETVLSIIGTVADRELRHNIIPLGPDQIGERIESTLGHVASGNALVAIASGRTDFGLPGDLFTRADLINLEASVDSPQTT